MSDADWGLFSASVIASEGKDPHDILARYRTLAYTSGIPWNLRGTQITYHNMQALLKSMAKTFTTTQELGKIFDIMDQTREHGWPGATSPGGDILIARAEGKRGTLPLPHGWEQRAESVLWRGRNSSASFWAGTMLRAAGHHVPERKHDDPGREIA